MFLPRESEFLVARAVCYSNIRGYYNCDSAWNRWGRWVLAGVLVGLALLFLVGTAMITASRRRRAQINNTQSTPMAYQAPPTQYQAPPPTQQESYGNVYPQQEYGNAGTSYAAPTHPPPAYKVGEGENASYYK